MPSPRKRFHSSTSKLNHKALFKLHTNSLFHHCQSQQDLTRVSFSSAKMASRLLLSTLRITSSRASSFTSPVLLRSFQTSSTRLQEVVQPTVTVRRPVGAFRGGYVKSRPFPQLLRPPTKHFLYCLCSLFVPVLTVIRPRLFGFLLGSTLAGASVYYYILEEYKISNEMLTEDIYVCGHI